MRTILPDESTLSTKLDVIGNCGALTRFIFLLIGLLLSLIVSFVPPNTGYGERELPISDYQGTTIRTYPIQIDDFSPLNSFLILKLLPEYENQESGIYDFEVNGTIHFYDNQGQVQLIEPLNNTYSSYCDKKSSKCDPFIIYQVNTIIFTSLTFAVSVQSPFPTNFRYQFSSESQIIAIVSFVFISLITVISSLVLFWIAPRRLKPTQSNHKATIYLAAFLIYIDGPWLIIKYYSPGIASPLFDFTSEIFHMAYLIAVTYFVSAKTVELPHAIFNSWIVRSGIIGIHVILIVIQFVVTKLMPLCTLSVFIDSSSLKIPIIACSVVFHVLILGLLIYGVFSLQIEKVFVLVLSSFSFIILEVTYIIRLYKRIWIPFNALGVSFAAEFFYILMANIMTIFFLIVNTPIKKLVDDQAIELESNIIPDVNGTGI